MSEDSSITDITNSDNEPSKPNSRSHRQKKEELFGFPRDDVTLGLAAAGLGLAGLVGAKIVSDMVAEGKLPNPFAPQNPRINYTDVYEQQRQQQEWAAQQQQQLAAHQGHHESIQQPQLPKQPEGGDPSAQTMPAFSAEEDLFDVENTESFSTAPPKRNDRFSRVNVG